MSYTSVIKKQSYDYEIIAMVHHEIGHTIVCLYYLFDIDSVSVMTANNPEGSTEYFVYDVLDSQDDYIIKQTLIHELIATYAGLEAEKIYYKDICGQEKLPMHLRIGSSSDISSASEIIRKNSLSLPGKETQAFKKQLQKEANAILTKHWLDIKLLSHLLYKEKKIFSKDIKRVLTTKSEFKEF